MAKKKNQDPPEADDIRINLREQAADRTSRYVPEEEPDFGEFSPEDAGKEEEMEQGLSEIYQDENGDLVDVHKLEKIRRRGFILSFFNFLFLLLIIGGATYYLYENWYKKASLDEASVYFKLLGEQEVVANEEIEYVVTYRNESRIDLDTVKVNLSVPKNFILKETEPASSETKGLWEIGDLKAGAEGSIKIRGVLLGSSGYSGVMSAYLSYSPPGITTEYKKESFVTSKIIDTGIDFELDYYDTVMLGETEEILVKFRAMDMNFINDFRVSLEPRENMEILSYTPKETSTKNNIPYATFVSDRPGVWSVEGVLDETRALPVQIKIKKKASTTEDLIFIFDKKGDDGQYYEIYRQNASLTAMENDLNLSLIINGQRDNMGVDFGEKLNYSIVYNNKGDADLKDVMIMAVLNGDYLDWTTLEDQNKGREKGATITWSKEEIPALAEIKKDQEGVIDFSIKVFEFGKVEAKGKTDIESYARFSIGKEASSEGDDNKSNILTAKINSDLSFSESLLYFNEDNIPVGEGPNPPQVGQETSYKVFWKINNNLHELSKLGVTLKLPKNVLYDAKDRATAGNIVYSQAAHEVVWNIGRLPTSVYEVSAEFSVSVTPTEEDRNKIMVIIPGSKAQAIDAETNEEIIKETKAKTSKLEDDEIGHNDGIVD